MKCKYHPDREAQQACAHCGKGLCDDCSQAIMLGEYYCYSCTLFPDNDSEYEYWEPLKYIFIASSVSVLVMLGNIIFP